MESKMKNNILLTVSICIALIVYASGCASDDTVASNPSTTPVTLSTGFSMIGTSWSFQKTAAVDSLRIDSIVVVLQRIKFESHIDDAVIDSTGQDSTEDSKDANYTFRGPFIVHVRDSMRITFATQLLPAGNYTGIKYKIHAFRKGEHHYDSDDFNNKTHRYNSDSIAGYSVAVWGTIKKDGIWIPYAFKSNVEVEFKLRGDFSIAGSTSTVTMALRFNTGTWFTNYTTGVMLDPTDTTSQNRALINQAIKKSFEKGRGGRDENHDGNPDA
jgi:hypothetical protein